MKFSVLITVYHQDNPDFFDIALKSIWDDQSLKPNEIILVADGPLNDELNDIVSKWLDRADVPLILVRLEFNSGLPAALNKGLENCNYELVARMDSDDISTPDRFERQIDFMENNSDITVSGSWIREFSSTPEEEGRIRKLPQYNKDIYSFAKLRCPMNHMSVVYKKDIIIKSGGYANLKNSQDYHLWGRLLSKGFKFANIPDVLVLARADSSLYIRRGGMRFLFIEYRIQNDFYRMGFLSLVEALKGYIVRVPVRLMPSKLRFMLYSKVLRSDT